MGKKVTYPYHVVASAGESKEVTIVTNTEARPLKITRIVTVFPLGDYGELYISYWVGVKQVHPESGELNGDNVIWDDDVDITIPSGSSLKLKYRNTNDTETREAFIHVIGEYE